MLIGTLAAGAVRSRRLGVRLGGGALAFGALMPLLGLAPGPAVAAALLAVMGAAAGQVNVIAGSWLMRRTDPRFIGRVVSVLMLTTLGIGPVSLALAGAVAQVSVPLLFTAAAALMLLAGAAALANRAVRTEKVGR